MCIRDRDKEEDPLLSEYQPVDCDDDPEFQLWKSRNIETQKQEGFHNVQIKLILGDFSILQARSLAKIAEDFAGGKLVATVNQNLMIPWVKENAFGNLFTELKKINLHKAGTEEIRDITCCPGSETCNLGITASRGLVDSLNKDMENGFKPSKDLDHITIKASGCPNSCGQHHIANIGFHGAAMKAPSGEQIPAYELFLGGNYGGVSVDKTAIGQRIPRRKIPSKQVPRLLRMMLAYYQENRHSKEIFNEFVSRVGNEPFENMIDVCADIPSLNGDSQDVYMDWEKSIAYKLERGEGECSV